MKLNILIYHAFGCRGIYIDLLSVKVIYDYKTLLSVSWSHQPSIKSIFPRTSLFPWGTSLSSSFHNPFPVVSLCHPGYCVSFCCSFIGQSCRQSSFIVSLWFPHAAFPQAGCYLFLDNKCPWVSLVWQILILLSFTSYSLQLL